MPVILPSVTRVHPNFVDPGLILQYNQASGAFDTLATGDPMVKLGSDDLYVYMRALRVRTQIAAGQASYNLLPSCVVEGTEVSTPTYLFQNRYDYSHHDVSAGTRWGISVPEALRRGSRQGHFQQLRGALLYGMNPQNGEGLINAPGATAINLPPDSNGNDTLLTYDNGQLALFFLQEITNIQIAMFQLGMPTRVVILGPQRILGTMSQVNVVQLTQYQRQGAGTGTTASLIDDIMSKANGTVEWAYDDTLIGKGQSGHDMVIITVPEINVPKGTGKITTAEFNELQPSQDACNLMYLDMAAPREIPTPVAGGVIDTLVELRGTSGWPIWPEATVLLSVQYS